MVLPLHRKTVATDKITAEFKLLTVDLKLNYDRKRCTGCGTCILVCPKNAIERGPVGAAIKGDTDIPAILIDENKCVFCGTCAYMCPFFALKLEINGEPKILLSENKAVPPLPADFVDCERKGIKARKQFRGKIRLYPENCPGGCSTCANICPTGALYVPLPKAGGEKAPKIALNEEKCIYCGACVNACPTKCTIMRDEDQCLFETECPIVCVNECPIELQREVVYDEEGEYTQFWLDIVAKLRSPLKFYERIETK
jgi:formate hydrogenlyase subunit 6/NADH:ubiquinone oxidoreductase subunit I